MVQLQDFRHTCEQHEGMAGYGWDEYDVRNGGRQTIHDAGNFIDITTEFVKIPGGQHGGSWGVRVKGTPRENAPEQLVSTVIFYAAMEGFGSLQVANERDELGIQGDVRLEGQSNELGNFTLDITRGPGTNQHPATSHESFAEKPLDRTMVASFQVPEEAIWQTKRMCDSNIAIPSNFLRWGIADLSLLSEALIFTQMKAEIDRYIARYGQEKPPPPWQTFTIPNDIREGNTHVIQRVYGGAFEVSKALARKHTTDNLPFSSIFFSLPVQQVDL